MREVLQISDPETERSLLGPCDANLRSLRDLLGVNVSMRECQLTLDGPATSVRQALSTVQNLLNIISDGGTVGVSDIEIMIRSACPDDGLEPAAQTEVLRALRVFGPNKYVKPRSAGQAEYLKSLEKADVIFCAGPAGTGKTYLAVAQACAELTAGRIGRIILTRPAVEAGEKLGFLPGDYREKVHPYLRPLYDSLGDMIPDRELARYIETGSIEVVPLAFMRGRTLNGAYAILDEAQNTTVGQMRMFLTRLGWDSRAAVVGDVTQVDLRPGEVSGLAHAMELLKDIDGLDIVHLGEDDVVRHKLVKSIVKAYEDQYSSDEVRGDG